MSGDPKPQKKKRWSWWKTLLLVLVRLAVGLAVARWQWGRHADKALQAEIDAIRARGEPLAWINFRPEPIPDEENAAEVYRQAWAIALLDRTLAADDEEAARLDRLASMVDYLTADPDFRWQHAEDMRQILALSAESLALCRKARGLKQADWKINFGGPALTAAIPPLSRQRDLAKLLGLATITAHEAGAYYELGSAGDAAAVEYVRDTLAAGRAVGTGPTLIHALVHLAIDALARRSVEQIAPALRVGGDRGATARQVRELIAELLDEKPIRESMVLGLMGERSMQFDTFERFRRGQFRGTGLGVPSLGGTFVRSFQPMLKIDEVRMLRHMTGMVEAMREETFPAAAARMPVYQAPKSKIEMFTKLLSSILTPSLGRVATLCYRQLAMRKMAAVALAIRLYEIDTGRRPERLADLVGKYLPALPTDPFAADGRPLGYLPQADKPRLYSINDDGKDDAGEFALHPDGSVKQDMKDLVLFLNAGGRPLARCDWEDPTTQPGATTVPASMPATVPAGR